MSERPGALAWIPAYDRRWLATDVVAGVTTASVIIPKAMAYATVAGVAVQVGLYTALLPMAAYALVGSSRVLSVSTTTTIGILTAAAIADVAPDANLAQAAVVATTLAVLVGLMLLAAGLLRLGFVADFISEPVLTGFKAGIGVVILVDQAPKLLGLHLPKGGVARTVTTMLHGSLPETHETTLALAVGTIAVMLALVRWVPRAPAPLVGVAVGIAASAYARAWGARRVDRRGDSGGTSRRDIAGSDRFWPGCGPKRWASRSSASPSPSRRAARSCVAGDARPEANRELLALGLATCSAG